MTKTRTAVWNKLITSLEIGRFVLSGPTLIVTCCLLEHLLVLMPFLTYCFAFRTLATLSSLMYNRYSIAAESVLRTETAESSSLVLLLRTFENDFSHRAILRRNHHHHISPSACLKQRM
jgi:hypothetical protein